MNQQKTGVLLVNLGTPDAPTASAVRRYLRQFLSDRRVVDVPRWWWWLLLRTTILPLRAPRVAKLYQSIWLEEGSPLLYYSRKQQQKLAAQLELPVTLGMSYGTPSLPAAVDELLKQRVDRIIVLALYPQYSCSTVAAVWDELGRILTRYRRVPALVCIRDYATDASYIDALARRVRLSFAEHGEPDKLLLSYHGIPQRYVAEGDDYPQRCQQTTHALIAALGLPADKVLMTFQSRFGKEVWLQPYTDKTIIRLAQQGLAHIQVMCPGFAADCLETLEETAITNKEMFLHHGGKQYHYIPALNDDDAHIAMMAEIIREVSG